MEPYYYSKMNKQKQIVYHSLMQGLNALADEIKIPCLEGNELYDVFFQLRLDHPEIFWASGFKYKHYQDWLQTIPNGKKKSMCMILFAKMYDMTN